MTFMTYAELLDRIGVRHHADKSSIGHDYLKFYSTILPPREAGINLLEIGVGGGASIKMWLDWFTNGHIYGIDHNLHWALANDRLTLLKGDVMDSSFMESVARDHAPFDVIVDDGGHHSAQWQSALKLLWPALKPGGVFIIEDLHTDYLPQYTENGTNRFIPKLLDLIDGRVNNYGERQMGNHIPSDDRYEAKRDIDTITFRKSVVAIRKRV